MAAARAASLYLYALVERRPRAPLGLGIHRRRLELTRAGKAWVVFEAGSAAAPSPARILAHDRVIRRIARSTPAILPLRFGSTAADEPAIRRLLASLSDPIARAFDRVRGAVQFTLRVRGRPAPAPAARTPGRAAGVGPGTRWLAERLARSAVPEIAPLTEATAPWVRAVRTEREGARRSARDPDLLATVYHLVAQGDVDAWRSAVAGSVPRLRRVTVSATGPWPPYAFAELA
jgi:hypothetical protein